MKTRWIVFSDAEIRGIVRNTNEVFRSSGETGEVFLFSYEFPRHDAGDTPPSWVSKVGSYRSTGSDEHRCG